MTEQSNGKYPEKQSIALAKYKAVNQAYKLAKANPLSTLKPGYISTLYCCRVRTTITAKGVLIGEKTSYCKQRWCAVCERIRMGKQIKDYLEVFESFQDARFVTVTRRVTLDAETSKALDEMTGKNGFWRKLLKSKEAKRRRKTHIGFRGIKKIECKFSRVPGHLHCHFHFLIDGLDNAEWLVSQWLKYMGSKADVVAQSILPADKGSLIELCKYFTKTSADDEQITDYKRLDTIYHLFRGRRLIQTFGGIKESKDVVDSETEAEVEALLSRIEAGENSKPNPVEVQEEWEQEIEEIFTYDRKRTDWYSEDGDAYSGFTPTDKQVANYECKQFRNESRKPAKTVLDGFTWLNKWPELPKIEDLKGAPKTAAEARLRRMWLVKDAMIDID